MKTIFTCFFLVCAAHTFSQDYNFKLNNGSTGSNEEFYSVAQIADGSFVAVGYTTVNAPNHGIFIVNINKSGNQLWTKTISSEGIDTGFSVTSTADGGFAVCGSLNNKMVILKFDNAAGLQWTKQYTESNGGVARKILQTSDKGYMIAGEVSDNVQSAQSYLIKTDESGNAEWAKKYFVSSSFSMIKELKPTSDGNFIFLANNSGANDTACIVKINTGGDVLWANYFGDAGNRTVGAAILQTNDGGYVIAGSRYKARSNGFALKLNSAGVKLWSQTTDADGAANIKFNTTVVGHDGGYAILGSGSTKDSNFYYAINIESTGTLQWSKTNRKADNDKLGSFYNVINSKDGGYAVVGSVLDNSGFLDGMMMKLDFNFATCRPDIGSYGSLKEYGTLTAAQPLVAAGEPVVSNVETGVSSTSVNHIVCSVLPLNLVYLNATLQKNSAELQWQTAQEINTSYFDVERSTNGRNFSAFKQVPATGNSNVKTNYYAFDNQPVAGKNWYRLKMVDKDGKYTYSYIVSVSNKLENSISINPNPVGNVLNLNVSNVNTSNAIIQITGMNGKLLMQANRVISNGFNSFPFDVSGFAKGIYIIKIIQDNNIQNLKWVKE